MKFSRLLFLLVPLLLTACGLSDQQKADYAAVSHSGVSPAIYDKMMHGDALSVGDIEALARARVNDGIILRYLRDHDTVYMLSSADVNGLHKAGVSDSIIDYMLQTGRQGYGYGYPYGCGYGPYDDPFWWGYPGFYGGFYGGYHGYHGYHGSHHGR